ncbi:MAG: hypothetical protein HQM16_09460 [Deltaproteobacteria bacterium]|nr:hypothetical protein [Deltaproteobacteria bacterium]
MKLEKMRYAVTKWVRDFDCDGVTEEFAIVGETNKLEKAKELLVSHGSALIKNELAGHSNWKPIDIEQNARPIVGGDPNKSNTIVYQAAHKIGDGTNINSIYFFLDVIEVPLNAPVEPAMFNLAECKSEVEAFFKPLRAETNENTRGELSPTQQRVIGTEMTTQIILFGIFFLSFTPIGVLLASGFPKILSVFSSGIPLFAKLLVVLVALFSTLFFLAAGLGYGWIGLKSIPFRRKISQTKVLWYEGTPIKKVFHYRPSFASGATTVYVSPQAFGAWLKHDGIKYAVDLSFLYQIPNEGYYRFYYIRRPGLSIFFSPYRIVHFEPFGAESKPVSAIKTTPPPKKCSANNKYYTVNDRPVRFVVMPDGGMDVEALNMATGIFERDMSYLSKCSGGEGDIDSFTEAEFNEYVDEIRKNLEEKK